MNTETDTATAEELIREGFHHDQVVAVLVREMGLTYEAADRACWSAFTQTERVPSPSVGIRLFP